MFRMHIKKKKKKKNGSKNVCPTLSTKVFLKSEHSTPVWLILYLNLVLYQMPGEWPAWKVFISVTLVWYSTVATQAKEKSIEWESEKKVYF